MGQGVDEPQTGLVDGLVMQVPVAPSQTSPVAHWLLEVHWTEQMPLVQTSGAGQGVEVEHCGLAGSIWQAPLVQV